MEAGIRSRGFGVDRLPTFPAFGPAWWQSIDCSSSKALWLSSNFVGSHAQAIATSKSTTTELKYKHRRCWSQRTRSGRLSVVCRAHEGLQLPNPSWFWDGVKKPLVQGIQSRGLFVSKQHSDVEQNAEAEAETRTFFSEDRKINPAFQGRELSVAAIDCIEQFSRLNGLDGKRTRGNFESSTSASIQSDPRNLVEFACFRFLARCNADFHPILKDPSFRRLTFSAMLAWQRPLKQGWPPNGANASDRLPVLGRVGEEAFIRIVPAIAGAADRPTAHSLYQILVGKAGSLSFSVWDSYCAALCKVQKYRDQQLENEGARLSLEEGESIISFDSDSRQPCQKWTKGTAWPGRLTLTDRALYFEANGLGHYKKATRLDLTGPEIGADKKMVGPFGVEVFNSAISVTSDKESDPWILEFVDFRGEGRRNIWLASIRELFAAYAFIAEYGLKPDDPFAKYVYGAKHGRKKVLSAAVQGIARLQAVQALMGKAVMHPERLLQFSYLGNFPGGELVLQAMAVAFWGGRMEVNSWEIERLASDGRSLAAEESGTLDANLTGTDGTVYLRNWATSPTWSRGKSTHFWKAKGAKGFILGKNHVVGGLTQVERAVKDSQNQADLAEKTQATIDGALLKGIPDNVDLLKVAPGLSQTEFGAGQELFLPFWIVAMNLQKLRTWENPGATVTFLFFAYGVIYMNWLRYLIPSLLFAGAAAIWTLRIMKTRGRLHNDFGKVTIREQPPSNTIQQIMALKDALSGLEDFLQNCNIALLKLRTVALSREPQVTNEVLLALLGVGVAMAVVPFRYLLAAFILDQFTCTLGFREKSVQQVFQHLRGWWITIPATPVVVLPADRKDLLDEKALPTKGEALVQAMSEWLGEESDLTQLTGGSR